jgi:hemerythrin superfamily protein
MHLLRREPSKETNMPQQDIYALLHADHEKVEQLFEQCENASSEECSGIFETLCTELLAHAKAEEIAFYAKLTELGEDIVHAREEHEEAEQMIEECRALFDQPEQFLQKLHELKESVLHHVQEEEGNIFTKAREKLQGQETQCAEEFLMQKTELKPRVAAGEVFEQPMQGR